MRRTAEPERLRLAAAPGSALAGVLSAARTRGPSDAQLRALEASLAVSLGAVATGVVAGATVSAAAPAVSTAPVGASALLSAGTFKVTAALVALAATASGVVVYRQVRSPTPAVTSNQSSKSSPGSRRVKASPPPPIALPGPENAAEAAPPPPVAPPPVSASRPSAVAAPSAEEAHLASAPSQRRHVPAPDGLALITRAQRTLERDPAAAFALIEENRRTLAQSTFAQEAEVIAVAALARLGRTDEARARLARFVARFPESVHAPRMRRVAAIIM